MSQRWTIAPSAVGRRDCSQKVEYAVEREIRSVQERFFYSYQFTGLALIAFPDVYESLLQFAVDGALQFEAPNEKPWVFYLLEATGDEPTRIHVVAFNRYTSYANYLAGTVAEFMGTNLGTGDGKLELTKGIPTVAGSLYAIQYALWGVNPTFDIDIVIHGLIGGQEEL